MPTLGRRAFLKRTAAVSAAAAATMVPGIAIPQAAAVEDPAALPRWHRVPCQLCGVGCGLLVAVEQGRAVAARGDPDSPSGQGYACVKGYHAVQTLYGRDRLTRALVRRGGALSPAPLSEALDLVSRRIGAVLTEHGPAALAVYGGNQWTIPDAYVAARLFRDELGCGNVESSARLQAGSARAGSIGSLGLDGAIGCYEDIDAADVFVLWDLNLAETDPVLFSRMLARKRRNPSVRIVELATRTTRTSHPADESLRCIPQTGLAIANASANTVRIDIEAPENDLADLRAEDFTAEVNLGGLTPGESTLPVSVRSSQSDVRIVRTAPEQVDVTLENLRTKEVPVEVLLVGSPQQGFAAGEQAVEPQTATVSGPESLVELVDAAVAEVGVTGLRVDYTDDRAPLRPRDVRGGEIGRVTVSPETARVSVAIEQREFSLEFVVNPEISGRPAAGYNVTAVVVDPPIVTLTVLMGGHFLLGATQPISQLIMSGALV